MHFQKLQSSSQWEEPARFLGTSRKLVPPETEATDDVQNKTAPRQSPTYHPLWSEEQGCTFCSIMRPRRSCFGAARVKTARFQFKMIRLLVGTATILTIHCCCCCFFTFVVVFVYGVQKVGLCPLITPAPPSLWWKLAMWRLLRCGEIFGRNDPASSEHNRQPQQHNKSQPIVGVGGSGGSWNAAALQRSKHTERRLQSFLIHSLWRVFLFLQCVTFLMC